MTDTRPAVHPAAGTTSRHEGTYQVVLHNDDVNSMERVVLSLMRVFRHSAELAAHDRGRAVAEVEAETPARQHCDHLKSLGLGATVENVQPGVQCQPGGAGPPCPIAPAAGRPAD